MSRKAPQNLEKMQLKEEISTKRYQNVEEMQLKEEISTKRYQNKEEMHSKKKMSWKPPQNREKPPPQRRNVPETTPKSGETTAAEGKCPGKHPQTGRNRSRRAQREHRCNKKRHPSRDGVFYLNGSGELTAEVVEQDVL